MRFLKTATLLLLTLVISGTVYANEMFMSVSPVMSAPKLDGKLAKNEWQLASRQFGMISERTGKLALRKIEFFIGVGKTDFYIAHRTWHPAHLKPSDTGKITLIFRSPDKKQYSFSFDSRGANRKDGSRTVCSAEKGYWTSETVIPAKALGVNKIDINSEWGFQVLCDLESPKEKVRLTQKDFAVIAVRDNVPFIDFTGMGNRFPNSVQYHIPWTVRNFSKKAMLVHFEADITSIENPYVIDKERNIPANGQAVFEYREGLMISGIPRQLTVRVEDKQKQLLYRRSFNWDIIHGYRWQQPMNATPKLDIAVHPKKGKIKARISGGNPARFREISSVQFRICGIDGSVKESRNAKEQRNAWRLDWNLPELPHGKYKLESLITYKDKKTATLSRPFELRTFAWENNSLGLEWKVIPPFKPIQVKGKEINFLQTGYRRSGLLFDAVYAKGENLLAAPVKLLIDGKEFQVINDTLTKKTDTRVFRKVKARHNSLGLTMLQEFDFDGFCKLTLKFNPEKQVDIKSMTLDIPLKGDKAKLFHAVGSTMRHNPSGFLPPQEGVIWKSISGASTRPQGFRPYIWFGDGEQGFAWCAESPQGWSRQNGVSSQEIIRQGNKAILRIHLVNKPCRRNKPFTITMAVQPTPVKPRPADFRKWQGHLWGWDDWTKLVGHNIIHPHIHGNRMYALEGEGMDLYRPKNNDYSYIDYIASMKWKNSEDVRKAARKFIARHGLKEPKRGDSLMSLATVGANLIRDYKAPVPYFNIRGMYTDWPEMRVYADEFFLGEWRPAEQNNVVYQCVVTPLYADIFLWAGRELLKHVPQFPGMYYDNVNDLFITDPELMPKSEVPGEKLQGYWNIFEIRELMRRTATMLAEQGKFISGYPGLVLHTTNVNMVPITAFACATLEWENYFGNLFYQLRYPEPYVMTQTLGLQNGSIPMVIVQASGNEVESRVASLLAVAFAYDLFNFTEAVGLPKPNFFKDALIRLYKFGYGKAGTTVIPAFDKKSPLTVSPSHVRATWVQRKDGSAMILIGNLGDACTADITLSKVGRKYKVIRNAETGEKVGSGSKCRISVARYGYAMLELIP